MHICPQRKPDAGASLALAALSALLFFLAGCAAPGPPLPPTLNLPQVQAIYPLSAVRVGNDVRLHWTTPRQTTDKLPVKGRMEAAICRSAGPAPPQVCAPVKRLAVVPGATDAVDVLPPALTQGPLGLLAYRIELMNSAGRTAGPSNTVYAASGSAPQPLAEFAGSMTRDGVELRWQAQPGVGTVELDRILERSGASGSPARGGSSQRDEVKFRPQQQTGTGAQGMDIVDQPLPREPDPGGVIDRTVEVGSTYRYTAQRVVSVALKGHPVELRSVPSATLTFAVRDVFPPAVPAGLVAVPGFASPPASTPSQTQTSAQPQTPTIDLSWEPVIEPDAKSRVAGYRVYRRNAAAANSGSDSNAQWQRIGPPLVAAAAYRDLSVVPGQRYAYRVTSVSTANNESAPSAAAIETAPAP